MVMIYYHYYIFPFLFLSSSLTFVLLHVCLHGISPYMTNARYPVLPPVSCGYICKFKQVNIYIYAHTQEFLNINLNYDFTERETVILIQSTLWVEFS